MHQTAGTQITGGSVMKTGTLFHCLWGTVSKVMAASNMDKQHQQAGNVAIGQSSLKEIDSHFTG